MIQGPIVDDITQKSCLSVRKYLPESEIILSTWEGSNVDSLDYDKVLFNVDPGAVDFNAPSKKPHNINRLILSTQAGINIVTRPYILKIRSDMLLTSDKICSVKLPQTRHTDYKLFKNRIIAGDIFTIKYQYKGKDIHYRPFHVSDWCYFGLTDDLKNLYDIPLVQEPEFSQYFKENEYQGQNVNLHSLLWRKMSPEQYILSTCLKKYYDNIKFEHIVDYTPINTLQSKIAIVNNFYILPLKKMGLMTMNPNYKNLKLKKLDMVYYSTFEYFKDFFWHCILKRN